jgi:hypothetical protein
MSSIVVKLFTRAKDTRKWLEVNPKLDYPDGTTFILRWRPTKDATNYRTKTLVAKTLKERADRLRIV